MAERGVDFLTSPLSSDPAKAGVSQALWGTFWIGVIVVVVAFPLGIATAVYLEEYAPASRLTRTRGLNIRNLAGVPSIVYGLLGLAVFVGAVQGDSGIGNGRNVIAGGLTVAVLVLPIVIITSAEALRAVPVTIREAGYGVGASRWQVTRHLVLPAAFPGILTGIVLSLCRARSARPPRSSWRAPCWARSPVGNADLVGRSSVRTPRCRSSSIAGPRRPRRSSAQLTAAGMIVLLVITFAANALGHLSFATATISGSDDRRIRPKS